MRKLGILLAVVLFGLMIFAETETYLSTDLSSVINRIELLEEYANMIYDAVGTKIDAEDFETYVAELSSILNRLELLEDYANMIYDTVGTKLSLEDFEAYVAEISPLLDRIQLIEEYANMIYDTVGTKLSIEDFEAYVAEMEEVISALETLIDDMKVSLDIHDSDILKIYETLGGLSEQISALNDVVLGAEGLTNNVQTLTNRLELLEDYANMIYDTVNTKLGTEDFEAYVAGTDERISQLEVEVLNIKDTITQGLPAIRDMLYELSYNLASVEERLSSYTEVSISGLKDEIFANLENYVTKEELNEIIESNLMSTIEDLKVTLNIHDSDILKIYETLGTLSEQIQLLSDTLVGYEDLVSNVEALMLKADMHDQDIVNIYDNLSTKADREQVDMLEASVTELYDSVNGLNEILTGLAAQIGDTDYLLRKQIADLEKSMNAKFDGYVTKSELEEANKKIDATKAEMSKAVEEVNKKVDTNKAETENKINNVNIVAWIALIAAAVAIAIPFVK